MVWHANKQNGGLAAMFVAFVLTLQPVAVFASKAICSKVRGEP